MNKEWQQRIIEQAGGEADVTVDDAGNISFGGKLSPAGMAIEPLADTGLPVLVDLSRLAVVDIVDKSAAETKEVGAKEFFQNQVCNDLSELGADAVQLNGYCSPKGRLLALFTVFAVEGGLRVLLPDDVAPAFIKRLQMFVLRANVKVELRTDLVCNALVVDASSGVDAIELPDAFPALPDAPLTLSRGKDEKDEDVQIYRWHDDNIGQAKARYVCIGSADALIPLWQSESFSKAGWSYWRWGDINAGIPNVFESSADQFIPQMLNMQLINGLSFKKGCYPGQEIVARMQYLGKLKKHMKRLHQAGVTNAPEPATTLTTDANNNAGQVVDAVVDEHGLNLLAVVNIDTPVSELILDGNVVTEAVLPYDLAPESSPKDEA